MTAFISLDQMDALFKTLHAVTLFGVILACIGNYFIISLIFARLFRPLARIKKVSNAFMAGDLTRRLKVTSRDDIGIMCSQLNTAMDDFERMLKRIKNSSDVIRVSVQDLSTSSREISTTSNQQAASVKEIVSTMEDSDQLAKSIAESVNGVAGIANLTNENVETGFNLTKDCMAKMQEIRISNSERIREIRNLGEKMVNIWEILNIINNIADQTRIIAFNAELEASAAGAAGKSFSIVASEIRRLADGTVSSTGEIKRRISEIQNSADFLVKASEKGTRKISEGWEIIQALQEVFEKIRKSSESSAERADQIAVSVNHQVSAFDQILLTLKQISEGSDNFAMSTQSTRTAMENLKDLADDMNNIISSYTARDTKTT